jgi:RimJ/RimL family protein N-acetyltransferase
VTNTVTPAPLYPSFTNASTALCPYNDDTSLLYERWFADQELVALMGDWEFFPLPYYEQTAAEYVKRTRRTTWLVCELGTGRPLAIGYAGMYLQPRHRVGIMRLAIAEPNYRRRGHGYRATQMMLDWAFRSLDLFSIHASMTESNLPAIALNKKSGFRECGRYRQSRYEPTGRFDEIHMELLRDEWAEPHREASQ